MKDLKFYIKSQDSSIIALFYDLDLEFNELTPFPVGSGGGDDTKFRGWMGGTTPSFVEGREGISKARNP